MRRAAGTLVAGEEVGDMFQHGVSTNVMVWSTPKTRDSLTAIRNLPDRHPDRHGQVPLATLADVAIRPTPNVIQRENASRRIDVGAELPKGRDLGAVTHDIQNRLDHMTLPLGYHAELLGEAAERQKAQHRLLTLAIVAALVIFLLLQAAFGSWRLASLMFFTLPMALVGGVLAAYAGVGEISLGALIGFYTVMGIAARNGIMMVTHFQHLERHEGETFGPALVLRGARERLSPILMTALATGLALLPLVLSGTSPARRSSTRWRSSSSAGW